MEKSELLARELSDLIVYCQTVHFELAHVDQLYRSCTFSSFSSMSGRPECAPPRWLHTEMCSYNENKGEKILAELRLRSGHETWTRGAGTGALPYSKATSANTTSAAAHTANSNQQQQQRQQQQQEQQQEEQEPTELSVRDDSSEPDASEPEPDDTANSPRVSHSSNPVSPSVARYMQFTNSHFVRLYPKGTS